MLKECLKKYYHLLLLRYQSFKFINEWRMKWELTTVQEKARSGMMQDAQQQQAFLPASSASGPRDSGFKRSLKTSIEFYIIK